MITQDTAARIWNTYREIAAGERLLKDMKKAAADAESRDEYAPSLRDHFGRRRQLELGIPQGDNSHRLLNVSPVLAVSMIRAHIALKKRELTEANEAARVELDTEEPAAEPLPYTGEDEHPEDYDGPCGCDTCLSYAESE